MNGFEIFDRYDFVMYLLVGVVMVAALALGAPLWAAVLIMFAGCTAGFIRHFDEFMGPAQDPDVPSGRQKARP